MKKILLADDDAPIRKLMSMYIQDAGMEVVQVEDGFRAWQESMNSPDAILLDYMMPEMDGLVSCEQIRRSGYSGPIIIITGDESYKVATTAMWHGANYVLLKPTTASELIMTLNRFFEMKAACKGSVPREFSAAMDLHREVHKKLVKDQTCSICNLENDHTPECPLGEVSGLLERFGGS